MIGPDNKRILKDKKKSQSYFEYEAKNKGTYKFILDNTLVILLIKKIFFSLPIQEKFHLHCIVEIIQILT